MVQTTISIGQVAKRTGLAVSAIRYYEEQGLVQPERNQGGQRRFLRSDIRRLSFVLIAQQFGFSIGKIRSLLEQLPSARTPTPEDWARISEVFQQDLDEKIRSLNEMKEKLNGCIGCGCLSLTNCALYNPEDKAAQLGSGPRYLMGNSSSEIL